MAGDEQEKCATLPFLKFNSKCLSHLSSIVFHLPSVVVGIPSRELLVVRCYFLFKKTRSRAAGLELDRVFDRTEFGWPLFDRLKRKNHVVTRKKTFFVPINLCVSRLKLM